MLDICSDKNVGPELVCRPKEYAEHRQCAARASVLREMARQKVSVKNISLVSGLDERQVYRLINSGNGHGPISESVQQHDRIAQL